MEENEKNIGEILVINPEVTQGNNSEIVKLVEKEHKEKTLSKLDILKKLSPGTPLRDGLDDILRARDGALIVAWNPAMGSRIFEGGFKVNCKFTSKRLSELSKMDGAIILSEDFKKILYCNTLLVPDIRYSTVETGTRHQTAERIAKQTGGLVIAVSERRAKITVYYKDSRFVLHSTEELLRRATETLQILEKQRDVYDELLINMNILEVTNLMTISEVCTILQRTQMIKKMADIINEQIVELGREGIILRMRMREITKGIDKDQDFIIKDYKLKQSKVKQFFDNLSFEGLLDSETIARLLFGESSEIRIFSRGYRLLSKTSLNESEIRIIVSSFNNLEEIFSLSEEGIKSILKSRGSGLLKELNTLKDRIMVGKKI
jgi:diadenylate cyclase